VPDIDDVTKYNTEANGNGPTNEDFAIDWFCRGLTQWTKDCATIFTSDFIAQHRMGNFPLLRGQIHYSVVKSAFTEYVLYLKRRYIKETLDPEAAAVQKRIADKRSRSLNRRQQVIPLKSYFSFCRFLIYPQLLGRRLALLKHHHFPKACVKMVEELSADGMSSEESEGEAGMPRVFKIKKLDWRSEELSTWLHRVDDMPVKNKQNSVLHHRSMRRVRNFSDKVSRRPPVCGLSVNLYKGEWLGRQDLRSRRRLGDVDRPLDLAPIDEYLP
jgi:hypothetical protein